MGCTRDTYERLARCGAPSGDMRPSAFLCWLISLTHGRPSFCDANAGPLKKMPFRSGADSILGGWIGSGDDARVTVVERMPLPRSRGILFRSWAWVYCGAFRRW